MDEPLCAWVNSLYVEPRTRRVCAGVCVSRDEMDGHPPGRADDADDLRAGIIAPHQRRDFRRRPAAEFLKRPGAVGEVSRRGQHSPCLAMLHVLFCQVKSAATTGAIAFPGETSQPAPAGAHKKRLVLAPRQRIGSSARYTWFAALPSHLPLASRRRLPRRVGIQRWYSAPGDFACQAGQRALSPLRPRRRAPTP